MTVRAREARGDLLERKERSGYAYVWGCRADVGVACHRRAEPWPNECGRAAPGGVGDEKVDGRDERNRELHGGVRDRARAQPKVRAAPALARGRREQRGGGGERPSELADLAPREKVAQQRAVRRLAHEQTYDGRGAPVEKGRYVTDDGIHEGRLARGRRVRLRGFRLARDCSLDFCGRKSQSSSRLTLLPQVRES